MNEKYPKRFEVNSNYANPDFAMFASEVAINMDNHRLGRKDIKIDYGAIFRMGKIIYECSQDLKQPLHSCFPGVFTVLDYAVEKTFERNEEFKTPSDIANKLEKLSQDFAGFGSLSKQKQEELENFCVYLSSYLSAHYMPRRIRFVA